MNVFNIGKKVAYLIVFVGFCFSLHGMQWVRNFTQKAALWARCSKLNKRTATFSKKMSGAVAAVLIGDIVYRKKNLRKEEALLKAKPEVSEGVRDYIVRRLGNQGVSNEQLKKLIIKDSDNFREEGGCLLVRDELIRDALTKQRAFSEKGEAEQWLAAVDVAIAHNWAHVKNQDSQFREKVYPFLPAGIYYGIQAGIKTTLCYVRPAFLQGGNIVGGVAKLPLMLGALLAGSYVERAIGNYQEDRANKYAIEVSLPKTLQKSLSIFEQQDCDSCDDSLSEIKMPLLIPKLDPHSDMISRVNRLRESIQPHEAELKIDETKKKKLKDEKKVSN